MDVLRDVGELTFRPRELKFREVQTMLYHFGYKLVNSKGSHFRFKKKNFLSVSVGVYYKKVLLCCERTARARRPCEHLALPVRARPELTKKVKKWYVKAMAKILLSQLPLIPPL